MALIWGNWGIRSLGLGLLAALAVSAHQLSVSRAQSNPPVVTVAKPLVRDIVEDGEQGFVVPVGDVENFADRLQRLAHQEPLRAQMGKSGRARVENDFRIQDTARGYEELLTATLARKARKGRRDAS